MTTDKAFGLGLSNVRRNTRQQWDREEDNMALWARILYKYGVPSGIALFLVWFTALQLNSSIKQVQDQLNTIKTEVHDHVFQTGFYMRAVCIMTAKQSGQPVSMCEPPPLWER